MVSWRELSAYFKLVSKLRAASSWRVPYFKVLSVPIAYFTENIEENVGSGPVVSSVILSG